MKTSFCTGLVILTASACFGSETNLGNPLYSGNPSSNLSSELFSVMETHSDARFNYTGSMAVFAATLSGVPGNEMLCIGLATADHVLTGVNRWNDTFHSGAGGTLGFASSTHFGTYISRSVGYGGVTGAKEDLGFSGLMIDEDEVTAAQWSALTTLVSGAPGLATASATAGLVETNYGWGTSGQYWVEDVTTGKYYFMPTFTAGLQTGGPFNGDTLKGVGFYSSNTMAANYQSGIDRFTNTTSNGLKTYSDGTYTYNALYWSLQNKVNYGQINSGDSGGGIISFTGSLIGVNTYAVGQVFNRGRQEGFAYGSEGGGVGFTNDDVTWLTAEWQHYDAVCESVPEPSEFAAMGLGILAFLFRRRK